MNETWIGPINHDYKPVLGPFAKKVVCLCRRQTEIELQGKLHAAKQHWRDFICCSRTDVCRRLIATAISSNAQKTGRHDGDPLQDNRGVCCQWPLKAFMF